MDGTPSGVGNQVSAEFNLAYRWHSCISDKDDKWTQELYKKLFGKEAKDISLQELLQGLGKWEHGLPKDPQKRPFADLKRDADGKLPDDELVEILTSAIEDTAGLNLTKYCKPISRRLIVGRRFWTKQHTYLSKSYHHPWYAAIKGMEPWLVERIPGIFWVEAA